MASLVTDSVTEIDGQLSGGSRSQDDKRTGKGYLSCGNGVELGDRLLFFTFTKGSLGATMEDVDLGANIFFSLVSNGAEEIQRRIHKASNPSWKDQDTPQRT